MTSRFRSPKLSAAFLAVLIVSAALLRAAQGPPPPTNLQVVRDGNTTGLLQPSNLHYLGAFRLPATLGADPCGYGFTTGVQGYEVGPGALLTYIPAHNTLIAQGRWACMAQNSFLPLGEIDIPTPSLVQDVTQLPIANYHGASPWFDPVDGLWYDSARGMCPTQGSLADPNCPDRYLEPGGFAVWGNQLLVTFNGTYGSTEPYSYYLRPLDFSVHNQTLGPFRLTTAELGTTKPAQGYYSGHPAVVPANWQSLLGGAKMLMGNGGTSISTDSSQGPAAFGFDPGQSGVVDPVPAKTMVYYTTMHIPPDCVFINLGGPQGIGGPTYVSDIDVNTSLVMMSQFRTAAFFGEHGTPANLCYGDVPPNGSCIDPWSGPGSKGYHAYPYYPWIKLYDLNDFAAVLAGSKKPWDLQPYALFQPPGANGAAQVWDQTCIHAGTTAWQGAGIRGATYDETNHRLFMAMTSCTPPPGLDLQPIIHVWNVQ
jgi:hypothetical protein